MIFKVLEQKFLLFIGGRELFKAYGYDIAVTWVTLEFYIIIALLLPLCNYVTRLAKQRGKSITSVLSSDVNI